MSDSVRPHRRQPTRLPRPWDSPVKNLEWVANAWKWKVKVKLLSRVQLFMTPWTTAHQAPPSMGFSRQEHWSGVPSPWPHRDHNKSIGWTHIKTLSVCLSYQWQLSYIWWQALQWQVSWCTSVIKCTTNVKLSNHPETIPTPPRSMEEPFSTKLVSGPEKVGNCCSRPALSTRVAISHNVA